MGVDREPGLEQQSAPHVRSRVQLQVRGPGPRRLDVWALPEEVEQRKQRDDPDEQQEPAPDPRLVGLAHEVAVALEYEAVGDLLSHPTVFSPVASVLKTQAREAGGNRPLA